MANSIVLYLLRMIKDTVQSGLARHVAVTNTSKGLKHKGLFLIPITCQFQLCSHILLTPRYRQKEQPYLGHAILMAGRKKK